MHLARATVHRQRVQALPVFEPEPEPERASFCLLLHQTAGLQTAGTVFGACTVSPLSPEPGTGDPVTPQRFLLPSLDAPEATHHRFCTLPQPGKK